MAVQEDQDKDTFELFYSNNTIYSNFYPAKFTDSRLKFPEGSVYNKVEDFTFVHVEQYMHACKALLFMDNETLDKILAVTDPMESKKLGRQVAGFEDDVWCSVARDIVTRGCWLKFSQNKDLWEQMETTGNRIFVECAPRDRRWGIGLGIKNPQCVKRSKWRGTNWLGQCLDATRENIVKGTQPSSGGLSAGMGNLIIL